MIELQPFGREDFARLISWAVTPEFLLQWAGGGFTYPLDERQLEEYLKPTETTPATRRIFKAVDTDSGEAVGHIELNNINWTHSVAGISRVLVSESARGKGVGEQMVRRVMEIGFGEMGMHRLELNVYDFNTPAIRLYEKLGFVKEGLIRESRRMNGGYWSHFHMSILEDEWRSAEH